MKQPSVRSIIRKNSHKTPQELAEHLRALRDAEPVRSLRRHDFVEALREMMESGLGRAQVERRKRRRVLVA